MHLGEDVAGVGSGIPFLHDVLDRQVVGERRKVGVVVRSWFGLSHALSGGFRVTIREV